MKLRHRTRRARTLVVERCEPRSLLSTLTVTSVTDGTPGSLRDTIARAASGDVIRFSPRLRGARLSLTQGELVIDKSLTIQGSGQTLDAGGQSRVIKIDHVGTNVSLARLTITGGVASLVSVPGPAYAGGGILVQNAALSLNNCVIAGNLAQGSPGGDGDAAIAAEGGGLFAFNSQVSLVNTSVVSNQSLGGVNSLTQQAGNAGGGGLFFMASQSQIVRGRIQGNLAQGGDAVSAIEEFPSSDGGAGDGGGVLLLGSSLSLNRTIVSANRALGGRGLDGSLAPSGGVGTPGPGIGGTAAGGAIFTEGAGPGSSTSTLSLTNVSLAGNVAQGGPAGKAKDATQPAVPGGMAIGGAIEQNEDTTLLLQNVQFQANQALGGPAAANIVQGGADTSSGGEAFGGAINSEFFTRINAVRVLFTNNLAQGARGGDSAAGSGTEAGVGGPAQGGAWNLRDTGGLIPSAPLPVTLTNVSFQSNRALAGAGGTGPLPADGTGSGGYATGGGMQTNGIFNLQMSRTQWLNNQAIAQQGEFAYGGALGMAFGFTTSQTTISQSLFRGNLARGGDDPQSASLAFSSGGAILNNNPNTTIIGTTFINNTAQGGNATGAGSAGNAFGGALDSTGGNDPSLTLTNSRLAGNRALAGQVLSGADTGTSDYGSGRGGGIFLEDGTLNVSGVQFVGNFAQSTQLGSVHEAAGGALYIHPGATAQVARSFFQGNQAGALGANTALGGAVANFSNAYSDTGSNFTGNQAVVQGPGTAFGGGLYLANDASLSQSRVTRNAALARAGGQGFGGGIAFAHNPKVVLQQVVVVRNTATTAGPDFFGDHQS